MDKEDLYIGMLCSGPKGMGVISWVDDNGNTIYMTDIPTDEYYKVTLDEIDSLDESLGRNLK